MIVRFDHDTRVAGHLGQRAAPADNHRHADGHRFEDGQTEAFEMGGQDQHRRLGVEVVALLGCHVAEVFDMTCERRLRDGVEPRRRGGRRATREHQLRDGGQHEEQARVSAEQCADVLARLERAHEQNGTIGDG